MTIELGHTDVSTEFDVPLDDIELRCSGALVQ